MRAGAHGGQKKMFPRFPRAAVTVVVSYMMWVLGIQLESPEKTACDFNYQAICPAS